MEVSDIGEVQLKNITQPIRAYSLEVGVPTEAKSAAPTKPAAPERTPVLAPPDKPSIAVLAFLNMSGDPEQEYFADGITEDVITDLSKIGGLLVIARNSSFAYKGKSVDIRVVARELGVRSVRAPGSFPAQQVWSALQISLQSGRPLRVNTRELVGLCS